MVFYKDFVVSSDAFEKMIKITDELKKAVEESGIKNGQLLAETAHTTTGITVNEGLECLEHDMMQVMRKVVPVNNDYAHAHFLPTYGRTSANATGHLRGMLFGNHCHFIVKDGKLALGAAQDAYLVEMDGPQNRKVMISIIGE